MNKRIEHCLYQAGLTAQGCWEDLDTYTQEGIEKLAELIVKECANVAWYHTPDTEELEYSHLIEEEILKHFGVEE
jgi:hypothetical protein